MNYKSAPATSVCRHFLCGLKASDWPFAGTWQQGHTHTDIYTHMLHNFRLNLIQCQLSEKTIALLSVISALTILIFFIFSSSSNVEIVLALIYSSLQECDNYIKTCVK